ESVITCLGSAPPELAHDLIGQGMYLVGGGGMLAGLDQRLAHATEIDVHLVGNALEPVVLGAGRCIEDPAALRVAFHVGRWPGRGASALVGGPAGWARRRGCPLASGPVAGVATDRHGDDPISAARRALVDERRQMTLDELAALAALPDEDVPALAEAAHAVRVAWCGDTVEIEGILSAKTGGCPEDCHFCSQSSRFETPVKALPLLSDDEVLRAARETAELGASE